MRQSWIRLATLMLAATLALPLRAQISTAGNDPVWILWNTIQTNHYRLIYAAGSDSLARVYGRLLEKWYPATGASVGYLPGENYGKVSPVILHPYMARSNGSVALAPRRMDLYTVYDADNPIPFPWELNLAIHEGRHLAQLQFGRAGAFKGFHYLFGEMFAGAMSGVYPSLHLLEGDAVVAETALTSSGRGRTHDFLAWYRMSLDQGERRGWYQWRYGSFNRYTPDHYAVGYMTVAGMRVFYDDPLFMKRYFQSVTTRPLQFGNLQRTMREKSGKSFRDTWDEILDHQHEIWAREDSLRGPFTPETPLLKPKKRYADYSGPVGEWVIKRSLFNPTQLVKLQPDNREMVYQVFSSSTSKLVRSGDRLYWSEITPGARWTLQQTSRIRLMSGDIIRNFTKQGRFYNPSVSDDQQLLAATEYPQEGGTRIALFHTYSHELLRTLNIPNELQVVETAWLGDSLAFTAISEAGSGLYRLPALGGEIETLLPPVPVKINHLRSSNGVLTFTSDHNGVNNIYRYSPADGTLLQLTESHYGATDATLEDGTLVYTALTPSGHRPVTTSQDDLLQKAVCWEDYHRYPVADALSAQEAALGAFPVEPEEAGPVSQYVPVNNLIRFHSWAPLYFNYDKIAEASFETTTEEAKFGVTGLFQNDLGTFYGTAGLAYGEGNDGWRPSAHLHLTFTGWVPVFEINFDVNERLSHTARAYRIRSNMGKSLGSGVELLKGSSPLVEGSIQTYIPLNFSSNGWNRGFIPRMKLHLTSDKYFTGYATYTEKIDPSGQKEYELSTVPNGDSVSPVVLDISARIYSFQHTAERAVFPKAGIGLEAGYRHVFQGRVAFTPTYYLYGYGYLPGVGPGQGLRLSALWQHKDFPTDGMTLFSNNWIVTRTRGLEDSSISSLLGLYSPDQYKFTADYAIPFLRLDCSAFSPLVYLRNLELIPFADLNLFRYQDGLQAGSLKAPDEDVLWCAGADLNLKMGNFFWLPYETTLGIRVAWNNGKDLTFLKAAGVTHLDDVYVGMMFSTNF